MVFNVISKHQQTHVLRFFSFEERDTLKLVQGERTMALEIPLQTEALPEQRRQFTYFWYSTILIPRQKSSDKIEKAVMRWNLFEENFLSHSMRAKDIRSFFSLCCVAHRNVVSSIYGFCQHKLIVGKSFTTTF